MDRIATRELYFMELSKLGVKVEPVPDGWTKDEGWTLDAFNADYSGCSLDQLEAIISMEYLDNEITHIIADDILCETIRRLVAVSEYHQDEYASVALRIVEAFEHSDKWYS